jgi:hypothetical protein
MSLSKLSLRYPPILVRLLARDDGQAMTRADIARRCPNLSPLKLDTIASETSWRCVTIGEMVEFTAACHLDFTNRTDVNRIECYLRKNGGKPSFKYLTDSPEWGSHYFPLLQMWRRSLPTIPNTLPKPIQRLLAEIPKT